MERLLDAHWIICAAAQLLHKRLDASHRPAKGRQAATDGADVVGVAAADAMEAMTLG